MSFMKWWRRICTKLSQNKLLAKNCKHLNSIKGAYMLAPLILCLGTLDPIWAPLIIAIGIQNKHYIQIIKSICNTHCNKNTIQCYNKLSVISFVSKKKHLVGTKYSLL